MEIEYFVPPDEARSGTSTGWRSGCAGTPTWGSAPTTCACAPTTPTSSPTTPAASDIEYLFPIGWSELEGIANRGDFDLTQHAEFSGEKLEYFDTATGERYVPHVIEPAAGADRAALAFLVDAYDEEEPEGETAHGPAPASAPGAGQGRRPAAGAQGRPPRDRPRCLRGPARGRPDEYDERLDRRRYRRQDEIGTPRGVTVDHQTTEDRTVTCATATRWSRSASRSTSSRARSPAASLSLDVA